MTAPDKPTIDEQILQNQLAEADRRASGRPRAATYELLNGYTYVTKTAYDDLLAYADRMEFAYKLAHQKAMENGVERDELKRKYAARWVAFSAMHERAETAERQLAELKAKHWGLVKDAERWKKGSEIGFPKVHAPEHTGSLLTYWTNGSGLKYASAELAIDAMSAVALDKGEE